MDTPAAMAVVGADGTVIAWSRGAQRLLGYSADQVVGRPSAELIAGAVPETTGAGLEERESWLGTVMLRDRVGEAVECTLRASRLVGASEGPEWLVELVPTQDDRAGGGRLLNSAFDQSPYALAIFGTDGLITRINRRFATKAAASPEDVRGRRLHEVLPGAVFEVDQAILERVTLGGEAEHIERHVHLPGEPRAHAWGVDLSPLRDSAGQVYGVLMSALDYTEQETARSRLSILNTASERIGSSLDITRTAQELADVAVPVYADFVSVDLLDSVLHGDEPGPMPADGSLPLYRTAMRSVIDSALPTGLPTGYPADSPPTRCVTTGRGSIHPVTDPEITNWLAQDPARATWVRENQPSSFIVVPLRARGTTLGVVIYSRLRQASVPFGVSDLDIGEELAARAAVCIDNARRYTRERATALALQRSLLPRHPQQYAAVELASRYLPAGSHLSAGGDWFDAIPLSGARVALVVGDVVGHGIHASATMGRLRAAVRTLAYVDLPPEEVLSHLDDLVLRPGADGNGPEGTTGDLGATCLYAVYDPVSGRCTMASAGHPPPLMVAPDGTVEMLDPVPGPPLGLGGLPFESLEISVPAGSLLVLYTNGLIEARHRDVDEGLATLRATLAEAVPSLERTCDAVLKALVAEPPADDVALLIARTRALDASHVAVWDLPSDPAVVAQIRTRVSEQLASWGLENLIDVTELVASELVTNAIRHATAPIQLRLIKDLALICEVSDASSTTPHLRRAHTFDEGGRGLMLVAQLTEDWGTRHTSRGKVIWAEQPLDVP
jgi:PAS domain S-box-containing protein